MSDAIRGRAKLASDWLPSHCDSLLDCGCSSGYYTVLFAKKSRKTYGIDPNKDFIKKARDSYKGITFSVAHLEKLPFKDDNFDAITALEVIEHVRDEKKSVSEIHRVLKKGGTLVLTTPNKGLFGFLDPDNYVYFLTRYLPFAYKLAYFIKKRTWLKEIIRNPGYESRHRHYSLEDIKHLLGNRFEIQKTFRSGFLLAPLAANLKLLLTTFLGDRFYSKYLNSHISLIAAGEFWVPFGSLSYYVAVKAIKR